MDLAPRPCGCSSTIPGRECPRARKRCRARRGPGQGRSYRAIRSPLLHHRMPEQEGSRSRLFGFPSMAENEKDFSWAPLKNAAGTRRKSPRDWASAGTPLPEAQKTQPLETLHPLVYPPALIYIRGADHEGLFSRTKQHWGIAFAEGGSKACCNLLQTPLRRAFCWVHRAAFRPLGVCTPAGSVSAESFVLEKRPLGPPLQGCFTLPSALRKSVKRPLSPVIRCPPVLVGCPESGHE